MLLIIGTVVQWLTLLAGNRISRYHFLIDHLCHRVPPEIATPTDTPKLVRLLEGGVRYHLGYIALS